MEEIPAQGESFDPNVHNAVMHMEDEALGENTVVEVFQAGFKMGEKVIRHAMVKVANWPALSGRTAPNHFQITI